MSQSTSSEASQRVRGLRCSVISTSMALWHIIEIGDKLLIEGTGAYTSTYSSVAFNGIPPLKTYHI